MTATSAPEHSPQAASSKPLGWPMRTIWLVANAVCLLQAIGFVARPWEPRLNRVLGIAILASAIPATAAMIAMIRAGDAVRFWVGAAVFDAFALLSLVVDQIQRVEFRDPARPGLLIPYVVLFFSGIVLMGAPMVRVDRRRWTITACSALVLVAAMLFAMSQGVG